MTEEQREVYEYVQRCILRSQNSFMWFRPTMQVRGTTEETERHAGQLAADIDAFLKETST
jgi:hypothetical protein